MSHFMYRPNLVFHRDRGFYVLNPNKKTIVEGKGLNEEIEEITESLNKINEDVPVVSNQAMKKLPSLLAKIKK